MTVMGPLRSWETVFTKSFFICSMFLSSVISRRITATPTGSPNGVVTRTRLAWAIRPSGSGSSETPSRPATHRSRSGT